MTLEVPGDNFEALGDVQQSPDDLMDIHIGELVFKLASRLRRLKKLKRLHAPAIMVKREKDLVRIAETACRARVRELALFALSSKK
jgi:hypothetical protein